MATEDSSGDGASAEALTDYFESETRVQCLNLVAHLVRNTDEVPYVLGPGGSGKSRFSARLADELEDEFSVIRLSAAADLGLADAICDTVGVDTPPSDWVASLLASEQEVPLLVMVDDAEQLTAESQQAVLELMVEAVPVILLGDGPVPTALRESIREIDLPPFTERESRAYLEMLGRRAGAQLPPSVAARLYKTSGGWPGPLAERLASGMPPTKTVGGLPGGPKFWMLGVVVAALIALVLINQDRINQVFEAEVAPVPSVTLELEPQPILREPAPVAELPEPKLEPQLEPSPAVVDEAADRQAGVEPVTESETLPDEAAPASLPVEAQAESGSENQPAAQDAQPETPSESAQTVAVSEPEEVRASPRADSSTAPISGRDGGVAWLRAQAAKAYTLQLVGAREPAAIKKFIERHPLQGTYAVFERELSGKPWYSLVFGSYPDRDSAIVARDSLPEGLRSDDVWPRTFESIQVLLGTP